VFRAYFVYVWLILNCIYAFVLIGLTNSSSASGEAILNGFALFVAGLVVFKLIFATIYQIKWYVRFCCNSTYQASKKDVGEVFKQIRKDKNKQESSDEEDNDEEVTEMIRKASQEGSHYDDDDDDLEFDDAGEEEAEDRIRRSTMRQSKPRFSNYNGSN